MYTYSDAWFLTTLILLNKPSSLREIIATGDLINHAIFNLEEINDALNILISMQYVEINNNRIISATQKAHELADKTFVNAGLFRKADRIYEKLNRTIYIKPYVMTGYFTEDDMHQAYKQYIGKTRFNKINKIENT